MKPATKIIIFLVVAFIIVIIITVSSSKVVAPVVDTTGGTSASHESINPNASPLATPTTMGTYTLADVAKHKTPTDCWTTVNGGVYNLTPFVNQHPGGVANITKVCGIDGTSLFTAQHGSDRDPQRELATLKIGTIAK